MYVCISSSGMPKVRFVKLVGRYRGFQGGVVKNMAWSLETSEADVRINSGLIRPATEDFAKEAVEALKAEKVIAVPTDTLYGFACDAWYAILWSLSLSRRIFVIYVFLFNVY